MDLDGRLGRLEQCLESTAPTRRFPQVINNQVVPRIVASTMVVHSRSIIHQEPRLSMGLLDSILGKDGDKAKRKDAAAPKLTITNPFAARPQAFGGAGQSLGGTQPGIVIPISLFNPGPLGVKVEKRPNTEGTAIVNEVVPGSQAEAAGLKRGDILCFGGSGGQAEMHYDIFLEMARSDHRPLEFEVRRIPTKESQQQKPAPSNASFTPPISGTKSAEADHRKLAVIAAAEAREKANKAKLKPMKQVTKTTLAKQQQQLQQQQSNADTTRSNDPLSEEAKRAAAAAKLGEAKLAQQLGYNPYETARATAGQARTATVAVQHGTIQVLGGSNESHQQIPAIAPPSNALLAADNNSDADDGHSHDLPSEVQEALATLFSSCSQDTLVSTCTIMKTLLVNATTKGQSGNDADSAKFRKVRLANPKIKVAVVDVSGAVDVLMAAGFILQEQDGESLLIFPQGVAGIPHWLPLVLKQLESAATGATK